MKPNWLALFAGILVFAVIGLAMQCMRLESEADAAEAHAQAADERAGTCEAKFSYSTVIVEPQLSAAPADPGVNLYHGMLRLSVNSNQPAQAYAPTPRFVIPAQVTPTSAGNDTMILGNGPAFYWVNNITHEQRGPFQIKQGLRVQ